MFQILPKLFTHQRNIKLFLQQKFQQDWRHSIFEFLFTSQSYSITSLNQKLQKSNVSNLAETVPTSAGHQTICVAKVSARLEIGQHYIFYLVAVQPSQVALCTESHVRHICFEPTVNFRDVQRVNGGAVSAGSVLQLVVGEDLLHGF